MNTFHQEVWSLERRSEGGCDRWLKWIARAERLFGHDLDGYDVAGTDRPRDGFSLDGAGEAYRDGWTPEQYIEAVISERRRLGLPDRPLGHHH